MAPPSDHECLHVHTLSGSWFVRQLQLTELNKALQDLLAEDDESFISITRTKDELSVVGVYREGITPSEYAEFATWSAFKIAGPMEFNLTGVLSGFTEPLKRSEIGIFAVSTWNTDYILVRGFQFVQRERVKLIGQIRCPELPHRPAWSRNDFTLLLDPSNHISFMDSDATLAAKIQQGFQKRILPSRSRRGGPGVGSGIGSCDIDDLILHNEARPELDSVVPSDTVILFRTDDRLEQVAQELAIAGPSAAINVTARETYFDRPDVIKGFREQLEIEVPSFEIVQVTSRLRAKVPTTLPDPSAADSDSVYEKRHRKFEAFEKRQRLREKEKLKHEQYKLKERIDQLRAMDNSAFLAAPADWFSPRPLHQDYVDEDAGLGILGATPQQYAEGERRRREMLENAQSLEERYRILLPARKQSSADALLTPEEPYSEDEPPPQKNPKLVITRFKQSQPSTSSPASPNKKRRRTSPAPSSPRKGRLINYPHPIEEDELDPDYERPVKAKGRPKSSRKRAKLDHHPHSQLQFGYVPDQPIDVVGDDVPIEQPPPPPPEPPTVDGHLTDEERQIVEQHLMVDDEPPAVVEHPLMVHQPPVIEQPPAIEQHPSIEQPPAIDEPPAIEQPPAIQQIPAIQEHPEPPAFGHYPAFSQYPGLDQYPTFHPPSDQYFPDGQYPAMAQYSSIEQPPANGHYPEMEPEQPPGIQLYPQMEQIEQHPPIEQLTVFERAASPFSSDDPSMLTPPPKSESTSSYRDESVPPIQTLSAPVARGTRGTRGNRGTRGARGGRGGRGAGRGVGRGASRGGARGGNRGRGRGGRISLPAPLAPPVPVTPPSTTATPAEPTPAPSPPPQTVRVSAPPATRGGRVYNVHRKSITTVLAIPANATSAYRKLVKTPSIMVAAGRTSRNTRDAFGVKIPSFLTSKEEYEFELPLSIREWVREEGPLPEGPEHWDDERVVQESRRVALGVDDDDPLSDLDSDEPTSDSKDELDDTGESKLPSLEPSPEPEDRMDNSKEDAPGTPNPEQQMNFADMPEDPGQFQPLNIDPQRHMVDFPQDLPGQPEPQTSEPHQSIPDFVPMEINHVDFLTGESESVFRPPASIEELVKTEIPPADQFRTGHYGQLPEANEDVFMAVVDSKATAERAVSYTRHASIGNGNGHAGVYMSQRISDPLDDLDDELALRDEADFLAVNDTEYMGKNSLRSRGKKEATPSKGRRRQTPRKVAPSLPPDDDDAFERDAYKTM
ncbi:ACT-7 domain-containing protein [Mycena indigotica]|uniref:ACT-7 domain-containing protein n=1 Tax=Mycena indigotica TaxID=2126181 RepID=A0A8H6W8P5_9AGAR|nr:ACT-7 domain-containing protein [Mycena indigotica]KAF7307156.1 ACT-7 domain-containing protein [Mycena indigotica]